MRQSPRDWQQRISDLIPNDVAQAVAECLSLSRRFGDSPDPQLQLEAADVLWGSASNLGSRGSTDAALRVAQELRSRFAGSRSFKVHARVAAALSLIAELQVRDGHVAAATATYDEALAFVATSSELTDRGAGVALLLAKSRLLSSQEQREESIALLDAALAAIAAASAGGTALRTRQAAVAVVAKLDHLCERGRYAEARELGQQLSEVLGEVLGQAASRREAASPVSSESLLAAELAKIFNDGECWAVFEAQTHVSPSEAAKRAVWMYSVSDRWALSVSAAEPVNGAAMLVRSVADGYALLSREWSAAERASLPLPERGELEHRQLIRQLGVDDWASAAGHPLRLRDDHADAPGSPVPKARTDASAVSASVARDIVKCLDLYDLIQILSESDAGLEALRYQQFLEISVSYLRSALEWSRSPLRDQAPGVVVACWLIAGGFFAITHREASSPAVLAPARDPLRELLHQTGGYAWLADQDVPPPAWSDA